MPADSKTQIRGQSKLISRIDSFDVDTFPHSLILIGPEGSGKHLIGKYIAEHLTIDYRELDNKVDEEKIEDIMLEPFPTLYLINLDNALPKLQNNLLKIVEEPPVGAFMVGISTSSNIILPALLNRCQRWNLENYKREELLDFISPEHAALKEILLNIFNTPGQIIRGQDQPLLDIMALAENLARRVDSVTEHALFSIIDKLNFKQEREESKYDIDIFVDVLNNVVLNKVKAYKEDKWVKLFNEVSKLKHNLKFSISKQRTFEGFLIEAHNIPKS